MLKTTLVLGKKKQTGYHLYVYVTNQWSQKSRTLDKQNNFQLTYHVFYHGS